VGILAGHYSPDPDPGAVCPDGLQEVEINLAVAEKVVAALRDRGYEVDLLEEYDARLKNYRADAFLSIHSDSCEIPEASGFKVARVSFSAIPEIEDALVDCIYREYARITGLPRHDFSITENMHEYHAFRQIAPETPGAIIELGFMAADRYMLVNQRARVAQGVVAGLLCFLER
jgi:N-acetylmuramoyl-L-alanine amidase